MVVPTRRRCKRAQSGQAKYTPKLVLIGLPFFAPTPASYCMNGLSSYHRTKLFRSCAFLSDHLSNKKKYSKSCPLCNVCLCCTGAASRSFFIEEIHFTTSVLAILLFSLVTVLLYKLQTNNKG